MNKDARTYLERLLNTPSPSGFEQAAARVFRERVEDAADEVYGDVHGNTFAVLNPKAAFTFMLAGHIDEIGLMVTHIDEKGFLFVSSIGGVEALQVVGQRVLVLNERKPVFGVVGRKAIHVLKEEERKKPLKIEDLWVDIGAASRKEAEKAVAVGDPIVPDVLFRPLRGDLIVSRGCDDKVGAFVVSETIRALAGEKLNIRVVGVATVQEEVGLRGATTSAFASAPDAAIAIDVGQATDHPEADRKRYGEMKLGGGPGLHRGANINPILERALIKHARAEKIPHCVTGIPGRYGTDAWVIQTARAGVATALVSIPNRYMHSSVEVISLRDLDNAVKLISGYLAQHPKERDYRP